MIKEYTFPKYKLTKEKTMHRGKVVHRIQALKDFDTVKRGDLGGYVEAEDNLSQQGTCWIHSGFCIDDGRVEDYAQVYGSSTISKKGVAKNFSKVIDSEITDNAIIKNYAEISQFSIASGSCIIRDYSQVENGSHINKNAVVSGRAIINCSKVGGNAVARANATVKQFSSLEDCAIVSGFCQLERSTVKDNASLNGKVIVMDATVYGDANIKGSLIIKSDTNESYNDKEAQPKKKPEPSIEGVKFFGDEIKKSLNLNKNNKYGKDL